MEIGNSGFWLGKFKSGYILWNNQKTFEFTAKTMQEAIRIAEGKVKEFQSSIRHG